MTRITAALGFAALFAFFVAPAHADLLAGCPAGFNVGGGGECYSTKTFSGVATVSWTGLTWNTYELSCADIFLSTSGANTLTMYFETGSPGTPDTSSSYFDSSNSPTAGSGIPLAIYTGGTTHVSAFDLRMFSLSIAGFEKTYLGNGEVFNGTNFLAKTYAGTYVGPSFSFPVVTGVELAITSGTMGGTCTMLAHPSQ